MKQIFEKRIVPAATIQDADDAEKLAEALMAGGLDVIEVTFRTSAAEEAIRRIARSFPDMLVGAGTLLSTEQFKRACDAGAMFGVAPGLNESLVKEAAGMRIPFIPGIATPSEIDRGINLGCNILKFFPASCLGGVKTLNAFAGPFAHTGIKFLPTGGINRSNASEFLALACVAAVGGSWMVEGSLIKSGDWAEITTLAAEAVRLGSGL